MFTSCPELIGKVLGIVYHAISTHLINCIRPMICEKCPSMTPSGNIRHKLKTTHNDGKVHVIFEPLDSIGKLVALTINLF